MHIPCHALTWQFPHWNQLDVKNNLQRFVMLLNYAACHPCWLDCCCHDAHLYNNKTAFLVFPWRWSFARNKRKNKKVMFTNCHHGLFCHIKLQSWQNKWFTGRSVHFIASFCDWWKNKLKMEKPLFLSVRWWIFITFALWESDFISSGALNAPSCRWFMSHFTKMNNIQLVLWYDCEKRTEWA